MVAIGSVGLAKAKADHDETQTEHKQVHELTLEEKKELNPLVFFGPPKRRLQPLREEYESGVVVFVGKDVDAVVGMRVRMREGLISHGVGTITCLGNDGTLDAGCCDVVWDSDQRHTMGLHVKMGNVQSCRIGKEDHYDLILVEEKLCSYVTLVKHSHVLHGKIREHVEVVRGCDEETPVAGLDKFISLQEEVQDAAAANEGDPDLKKEM